jgi:hypothetical protein
MVNPSEKILRTEPQSAAKVGLLVLCGLGVMQLTTLGHSAWQALRPDSTAGVLVAVVAEEEESPVLAPDPAALNPLPLPAIVPVVPSVSPTPTPVATAAPVAPSPSVMPSGLPPLPPLPGAAATVALPGSDSGLPPLPSLGGLPPPAQIMPVTAAVAPPLGASIGTTSPVVAANPMTQAPTVAERPRSNHPEVDELLDVASQSRDLGDLAGALQAVDRADLLAPDQPLVLREKAMILSKMGETAKAQELMARANSLGVRTMPSPAPTPPPTDSLGNAFASLSDSQPKAELSLGLCTLTRDPNAIGQRLYLRVPVKSAPGVRLGPNDWELAVYFYDRVDGASVEPTQANPPQSQFDQPVDFASGEEAVTVDYHMPDMTAQEIASRGRREFGGYVIKLYCRQRLVDTLANPRSLLTDPPPTPSGAPSLPPVENSLLPLPR